MSAAASVSVDSASMSEVLRLVPVDAASHDALLSRGCYFLAA
ncbi:hypothetical protein [Streptomyces erythrochromogenes]